MAVLLGLSRYEPALIALMSAFCGGWVGDVAVVSPNRRAGSSTQMSSGSSVLGAPSPTDEKNRQHVSTEHPKDEIFEQTRERSSGSFVQLVRPLLYPRHA